MSRKEDILLLKYLRQLLDFFHVVDNLIKFCYKKRIKAPSVDIFALNFMTKLVDFSQKWLFSLEKMRLDSSSASFFQQEWSYSVGYEELMKFCLKF